MIAEVRDGVLVIRLDDADRAALASCGLRDTGDWCVLVLQARDERLSHLQQWPSRMRSEPKHCAHELTTMVARTRVLSDEAHAKRIAVAERSREPVLVAPDGQKILDKPVRPADADAEPVVRVR